MGWMRARKFVEKKCGFISFENIIILIIFFLGAFVRINLKIIYAIFRKITEATNEN